MLIKNCPCIQNIYEDYFCSSNNERCMDQQCIIKTCLQKSLDRCKYIHNKLAVCKGYNENEKRIRYEEHGWLMREFKELLDIEVRNGNS